MNSLFNGVTVVSSRLGEKVLEFRLVNQGDAFHIPGISLSRRCNRIVLGECKIVRLQSANKNASIPVPVLGGGTTTENFDSSLDQLWNGMRLRSWGYSAPVAAKSLSGARIHLAANKAAY